MSTTTIWRRALVAVAVLAVALAVIPAASAEEDPDVTTRGYPSGAIQFFDDEVKMTSIIPTTATIGGGSGVAPRIFCKWELPDMDSAAANVPFVQYTDDPTPSPVEVHWAGGDDLNPWDDDYAPGLQSDFPCDLTAADGFPEYASGAFGTIQVRANAEDLPEARVIELWAAVGPLSVDDVYWKVFHPDGSVKVQAHGTQLNVCNNELGAAAGDPLLGPGSMFWAANGTEQLTNAAITDFSQGLVAACQQDQLRFWTATFDLSKHQPCGEYLVEVTAVNGATETVVTNLLDVICFHELAVDFETVDFGTIEAFPEVAYKSGDLDFDLNDGFPTVKNLGSGGMEVGVEFYTMFQNGIPGPKYIDVFDAKFGIDPADLFVIDPWVAVDSPDNPGGDGIGWFGATDYQTLCANEVGKLDLSVHPSVTSGVGSFTGGVKIYARPDTGTDDMNNYFVNPMDADPNRPAPPIPEYTCANDNGIWGGYHDFGGNGIPQGNGYNGVPFGASFDDEYYDPTNNGTVDASSESGSSNQRSIWNQ